MLEEQHVITLNTTNGGTLELIKFGTISFQLEGKPFMLAVFRDQNLPELAESPGQLFIPFADKTTGGDTNDNGCYLMVPKQMDSGEIELDFNEAFNPYSAYNSQFISIIPPEENGLDMLMMTSERKYEDR